MLQRMRAVIISIFYFFQILERKQKDSMLFSFKTFARVYRQMSKSAHTEPSR